MNSVLKDKELENPHKVFLKAINTCKYLDNSTKKELKKTQIKGNCAF